MNNDDKELKELQKGQSRLFEGQEKLFAGQKELFEAQAATNKRIDNMEVKFDRKLEEQAELFDMKFNELATATNDRFDRLEATDTKIITEQFALKDRVEHIETNFMTHEHYDNIMNALDALLGKADSNELETAAQNVQLDRHENQLDDHESRIGGLEGVRA